MITAEKLKEIIVGQGQISASNFDQIAAQTKERHQNLLEELVAKGIITDENLGRAIANALNLRFINLKEIIIPDKILNIIPETAGRAQQAIVFDLVDNLLKIATTNPDNYEFFKFIEKKTGHRLEIYFTTPLSINNALKSYKSQFRQQIIELIEHLRIKPQDESAIVQLIDFLLEYALDSNASDIHLEPFEQKVGIRFRVDGILHEVAEYPKNIHNQIVFRVKIISQLRTDEHAAAQDGRFTYKNKDQRFDARVSILPVSDGENVVIRLLSESATRLSVNDLGLSVSDQKKIIAASNKPFGMILAAGPTGSGKTTTLYAIIQTLNRPEVNIMSIEDPIEYDIEHIQQTQVNPKKDINFATGLRSIARQDPDIIMVGEIRDRETAGIAINAAMTGHLLLSTIHANNASTAFPRLIEMSIEPFLAASSINVVIAQRLVRKICAICRVSYQLSPDELNLIDADRNLAELIKHIGRQAELAKINFYKGAGCQNCGHTGYRGRTGIFEVLEIIEPIRSLITAKATAAEIEHQAVKEGMTTILYDGISKIFEGLTTLEEIIRATKT